MSDLTPAEETAQREGLPIIRTTAFELLRIAGGNPMIVSTADGGKALVRLATAEELLDMSRRAGAAMEAEGLPPGPGMTPEQARELSRPLNI